MAIPVALPLLVLGSALGSVMVQPATLPASGEQQALLTLDRAGMVRLIAQSRDGAACTVVDHLRGPFRTSGAAGKQDCGMDLLLDEGEYKLRLASPRQGRGQVQLKAVPFAEQNEKPVRLEPGRSLEQPLRPGQQASFWIHLQQRQPVSLRASGRTAGQVQVWRAGRWREEVPARDLAPRPRPGQPIHEWWVQGPLEPGDYLFTVYGTDPARWAQGPESDLISVQYGFPAPPPSGVALTLPEWGMATYAIPGGDLTALLAVAGGAPQPTRLAVHGAEFGSEQGACEVPAKALAPECAAGGSGQETAPHVLLVRGAPGTQVELRWARRGKTLRQADGEYRAPSAAIWLEEVPPGEYLVGVHDVPADRDAAPLGCVLGRGTGGAEGVRELLAREVPRVAPGRPLHRAFNTSGVESLWFEVTRAAPYRIATGGERKTRCELYRVDGASPPVRLSQTADQPVCEVRMRLQPGHYALRLSGGTEGIERVTVAAEGEQPGPDSPARTGCTLRARIEGALPHTLLVSRAGGTTARGLVLRPLPLTAAAPVPVEVAAGETLRIPVQVDGELRVRPTGAAPAGCALATGGAGAWREGACWVRARGKDELWLTAPGDAPLTAWIERPPAAPARLAPLQPFAPAAAAIPTLGQDAPVFLDFDAGEAHALLFQVRTAGLYTLQTQGLLETECTLRTPTVTRLAADRGSGRGRNCLISTYLDPGSYLLTARTLGPSRGRAGVALNQRPIHDLQGVAAEGEAFFRVPAGDLVRQRLTVPAPAAYRLSTTALGASLQCRLEDREGWPLLPVPTPCVSTLPLPKGDLLWTQLPLTVESMRHTALARVRPPEVLKGKGPHRVELWHRYAVQLGQQKRSEFLFTLEADLDLFVELTSGMQGRITRQGEDAVLEVVAPQGGGASADDAPALPPADGEEPAVAGDADEAPASTDDGGEEAVASESAGEDETSGSEQGDEPSPRRRMRAARVAPEAVAPTAPPGQRVSLKAGRYRLITEHSHGDVAVSYWLQLGTEALTPGTTRELPVPTRVPLRVGRAGTLRLRTRGEADVACRVLDAAGRQVAASSEVGPDWNCGLAEPVAAGDYTLVIDSETRTTGTTRVTVTAPATEDVGALAHGRRYALGERVLAAALPPPPGDALLQVALEAPEPFSCAVEDEAGTLVASQPETRACRLLLHPLGHAFRLRAWTLERPLQVTAALATLTVAPLSGGRIAAGAGARAEVAQAGRYRTGEDVLCAPAGRPGVLAPCGPEVSLEAGPVVMAGAAGEPRVALEELAVSLAAPLVETRALTRQPFIQRQVSRGRAVHLLSARAAPGERAAPWCELTGGVQAAGGADGGACFAASGAGERATGRALAASEAPVEVELTRIAVPLPRAVPLAPGQQALSLGEATAALYDLPSGPSRLELLLPAAAWAVLLAGDRAVDLCPPGGELTRCALPAQGGQLLLHTPGERQVMATLVTLPAPAARGVLTGTVLETRPPPAGALVVRVPAAPAPRALAVEGAERCLVRRADGDRAARCDAALPPGVEAEVVIEPAGGALRVVAQAQPGGAADRFGRPLPRGGGRLAPGEGAPLAGDLVVRTVTVEHEALLHLRADAGVCALAQGEAVLEVGGLGGGCALDRLVSAGEYRVAVRPFAGEPLAGTASVTLEPVQALADGVGPERWLAPGGAALFRFQTASRGRVGVGLQQEADALECAVLDAGQRVLATGCQAYLELDAGAYLLAVRAPATARPGRFRPVVVGLAGARMDVPEAYLRDLFSRIGAQP